MHFSYFYQQTLASQPLHALQPYCFHIFTSKSFVWLYLGHIAICKYLKTKYLSPPPPGGGGTLPHHQQLRLILARSSPPPPTRLHRRLLVAFAQFGEHSEVFECGGIALHVACRRQLAKQPAHDLA